MSRAPRVSVVIPSHDKREQLELSLAGFRRQACRGVELELVVVDDGSTDGTGAWLEELARAGRRLPSGAALRVVRLPGNRGRAAARNRGAEAARGELILFSDADMIPDPQLVRRHVKYHAAALQEDRRVAVVGTVSWRRVFTHLYPGFDDAQVALFRNVRHLYPTEPPPLPVTAPVRLVDPEMVEAGWIPRLSFRPEFAATYDNIIRDHGADLAGFGTPWIFCLTGNVSVRREEFAASGGFDETFTGWGGEDWEWGYRLHHSGVRFLCVHDAISAHQEHPVDRAYRRCTSRANMVRFMAKHPRPEVLALVLQTVPHWHGLQRTARFVSEWQALAEAGGWDALLATLHALLVRACHRLAATLADPAGVRPPPEPAEPPAAPGVAANEQTQALEAAGAPHVAMALAALTRAEREASA